MSKSIFLSTWGPKTMAVNLSIFIPRELWIIDNSFKQNKVNHDLDKKN